MILEKLKCSAGIKSFAIRKRDKIKVTTRFMSNCSCFIYNVAETFSFPDQTVGEIYKKYMIEIIIINHVLTDTDSTALQFTFIADPNSDFPEDKFKDIIFEIIIATKVYKRFNTSHEFWDIFGSRKESRKKS